MSGADARAGPDPCVIEQAPRFLGGVVQQFLVGVQSRANVVAKVVRVGILFRPEHWWPISELAHTSVDLAPHCSTSHVFTDAAAVLVFGWGEADRNMGGAMASMATWRLCVPRSCT